ncbi:MAG: MazG-like family protein, partial [Patescibacteria group bacterium]
MDSKTTLEDIKNWAKKVRDDRGWHPDARSLAISIVLEAGEMLEHFQWKESRITEAELKKDSHQKEELEKEVGDVINYLCEFVELLDIDISDSLRKTLKKVEEKYPVDKIKKGGEKFYLQQKKKYR